MEVAQQSDRASRNVASPGPTAIEAPPDSPSENEPRGNQSN